MAYKTINLTPRIGSEIQTDVATLLSGEHGGAFRELLEQRGVLIFRKMHLSDPQQVAFGKTLGNVLQMNEGIFEITLDKKINPLAAEYLKGSFWWHIDGATENTPNLGALLSAQKLSPTGGQTLFANTYAAYDDLPEADKAYYSTLRVVHSLEASQRVVNSWPTVAELADWQRFDEKTHPLVWTHRSGRKSLVLGMTGSHIEGMSLREGRALLCKLNEWATQPHYVYQHEWQLGDLLIWDNTGTMHRVTPYAIDSGRMMHRTTLLGEEAIA